MSFYRAIVGPSGFVYTLYLYRKPPAEPDADPKPPKVVDPNAKKKGQPKKTRTPAEQEFFDAIKEANAVATAYKAAGTAYLNVKNNVETVKEWKTLSSITQYRDMSKAYNELNAEVSDFAKTLFAVGAQKMSERHSESPSEFV